MTGDSSHDDHRPNTSIVVNLYDGGGIEVTVGNYRPLGLHVRTLESPWCGEVVGGVVNAIVAEWVARQRAENRIREV